MTEDQHLHTTDEVGEDARRVIAGRRRLSDEEYAATGRDMTEEDFLALNRRRYGFD